MPKAMIIEDAYFYMDKIDESLYEPSNWEEDFLDSLRKWLDSNKPLTPRQGDALQRIYDKSLKCA